MTSRALAAAMGFLLALAAVALLRESPTRVTGDAGIVTRAAPVAGERELVADVVPQVPDPLAGDSADVRRSEVVTADDSASASDRSVVAETDVAGAVESGPQGGDTASAPSRRVPAPNRALTALPSPSPLSASPLPQAPSFDLPQAEPAAQASAVPVVSPAVAAPRRGAGGGTRERAAGAVRPPAWQAACVAAAAGNFQRAAVLLESVAIDHSGLADDELFAGAVWFNASLLAARSRNCDEARRLARLAAGFDDPWRTPSNVGWLNTLEHVRECDDFNLLTITTVVRLKPIPAAACAPERFAESPVNLKNTQK